MAETFAKAQAPIDIEGEKYVLGKGEYTDDLAPDNALHSVFVRSPVAHGIIQSIDIEDAKQAPGVVGVFIAADLEAIGCKPLRIWAPLKDRQTGEATKMVDTPRPLLADKRVRHAGEPIVIVVAETLGAAQDAAELVMVDIEELQAHTQVAVADEPVTDPIWDGAPLNQNYVWDAGDVDEVQKAIAAAPHKVTLKARNQRIAGSPMEPRAAIGSFDSETGRYTLYIGTQGPAGPRAGAAGALGVDEANMRVISKDVGGAFGLKAQTYPEHIVVCAASRILGQPVRWTATRSESLMTDIGGRDNVADITGAFDEDGNILAIHVDIVGNLGAYCSGAGPAVPTVVITDNIAGPYVTPKISVRARGVHTNTIPTSPYRGAGRPEAAYMLDRMMEKAARELGIDQIELRRKNVIAKAQMPYTTPTGMIYDSGEFAAVLDRAVEVADWNGFEARRAESAARGKMRGIGCSLFAETSGAFPSEPLDFRVTDDGFIEIRTPGLASGQRHASTFVHMMSQRLGIGHEHFRFIAGDSDDVPTGAPTVGSRVAQMTGSAALQAVEKAIERGRAIVSQIHEGQHNDIEFADGAFTVVATGEKIGFLEIPKRVAALKAQGVTIEETLDGVNRFDMAHVTFPNGCNICEVEVDPKTGELDILEYVAVDDCGTILNPQVVEGQLVGGMAQGLGQAIIEEVVYDSEGQLLSGTFMDYAMPRADDMPRHFSLHYAPDPTPANLVGAKGIGESGTSGALAAIVNAVEDALRPMGVDQLQMPLTPGRIWEAINAAGR